MIPVKINTSDINIKNIEPEELKDVLFCVNETVEGLKALGRNEEFSFEDIKQRYLETLINSLEFFCGIYIGSRMIGIIKGRIQSKESKELVIQSFILLEEYRMQGVGTKALSEFERHFSQSYSIDNYCALVLNNNLNGHHFWGKNQYQLARITQGNDECGASSMMIFEKRGRKHAY